MSTKVKSKPSINLMFLGGVGDDVTGSSTLIAFEANDEMHYGLIDVGGYQGTENRNYYYPIDGSKIDFVIITHAHYDHIGLLPKLYKDGFCGKVYMTEQAKSFGSLILKDAASINRMNSEMRYMKKGELLKKREGFVKKKSKALKCRDVKLLDDAISQIDDIIDSPLYTHADVEETMKICKVVKTNILFPAYEDILFAKLIPTTHQNGSVQIELYYKDDDEKIGILFTGDIGSSKSLLYCPKEDFTNHDIDYGVIESLHGTEEPIETLDDSIQKLEEIIKEGIKNNKNVILVGFSLDRDAMLVYLINKMLESGEKFNACIDAPLALSLLKRYQNFYEKEFKIRNLSCDDEFTSNLWFKDLGKNPFGLEKFNVISKKDEHIEVINSFEPKVIITSSANGDGGRVVDFFSRFIQNSNTIFVFCGWIYPESPSQILHSTKDGEIVDLETVRYIKHCQTYHLHGFSSHGYLPDVVSKFYSYPMMKKVILNHGEMDAKLAIQKHLGKELSIQSHIPLLYDAYNIAKEDIEKLSDNEKLKIFGKAILPFNMDKILMEINSK